MSMSLGVIETRGLIAAISAADAACKGAGVNITSYKKIGSGLVSVCFNGEISAVKTAIDCGVAAVNPPELVVASLVIARPDQSVINLLDGISGKKEPVTPEEVRPTPVVEHSSSPKQPTISTPSQKAESAPKVKPALKAEPEKQVEPVQHLDATKKAESAANAGAQNTAEVTKATKKAAVKSRKPRK